jgi:hypothetical protein
LPAVRHTLDQFGGFGAARVETKSYPRPKSQIGRVNVAIKIVGMAHGSLPPGECGIEPPAGRNRNGAQKASSHRKKSVFQASLRVTISRVRTLAGARRARTPQLNFVADDHAY